MSLSKRERTSSDVYAEMRALDEKKQKLLQEYTHLVRQEMEEEEKVSNLPRDLETLCAQWKNGTLSRQDIQKHYDALWCATNGITLEGTSVCATVRDWVEQVEDCQAAVYIDLETCTLEGPFHYADDDEMEEADALGKSESHVCAFAK